MIIAKKNIFTLLVVLTAIVDLFALGATPPEPFARKKPPPPPGLPIDEHVFIIMLLAFFFGMYIVYSHKLKIKTPL